VEWQPSHYQAKGRASGASEAHAKDYTHLYVIGFAVQPNARQLVENCEAVIGIPATYVQATPGLMMGDLLKNMRSSQIFSECRLPGIKLHNVAGADSTSGTGSAAGTGAAVGSASSAASQISVSGFRIKEQQHRGAESRVAGSEFGTVRYQVELLCLGVFDPITMESIHRNGDDVPGWFLDTDDNGLCFHVNQAFFPRTGAWDNLKKALKGEYQEGVWDHLAGTTSAPFEAGEQRQVAVKVIDDRGNELMVVERLA